MSKCFDKTVTKVLEKAAFKARELNRRCVSTALILLSVLDEKVSVDILKKMNYDIDTLRNKINDYLHMSKQRFVTFVLPYSSQANAAIDHAIEHAHNNCVGIYDLLYGLSKVGITGKLFENINFDLLNLPAQDKIIDIDAWLIGKRDQAILDGKNEEADMFGILIRKLEKYNSHCKEEKSFDEMLSNLNVTINNMINMRK